MKTEPWDVVRPPETLDALLTYPECQHCASAIYRCCEWGQWRHVLSGCYTCSVKDVYPYFEFATPTKE